MNGDKALKEVETNEVLPVEPDHLWRAFHGCSPVFDDIEDDGEFPASVLLDAIHTALPDVSRTQVIMLFQRLCLMVDLANEIRDSRQETDPDFEYEDCFPFAFFELVSVEPAYELVLDGKANVQFKHDVLKDALATFWLN